MKNFKLSIITLVAASLGCAAVVQAVPINGSIQFTGGVTLNGPLGSATAFTGFSSLSVLGGTATGTYAPLNGGGNFGGTLSFTPFGFAGGVLNPSPLMYLWSVNAGANLYTFEATDVSIDYQNQSFLNISGHGYAFVNGADQTAGTWSITDTGGGPTFTFGAATTVIPVPDGGTTVILLGASLFAMVIFRRRVVA